MRLHEDCDFINSRNRRFFTKSLTMCDHSAVKSINIPGNPANPHMANYQSRISSFRNWPYHIETSPETFAAAGFFYLGQGDRLKCFYCNEGLQDWVDGEEPWFEHAKWSPSCQFLRWNKGEKFVREISNRFPYIPQSESISFNESTCELPSSFFTKQKSISELNSATVTNTKSPAARDGPVAEQSSSSVPKKITNQKSIKTNIVTSINPYYQSSDAGHSAPNYSALYPTNLENSQPQTSGYFDNFSCSSITREDLNLTEGEIRNKITSLLEQETCKVCFDRKSNCLFVPCGHLCCCIECGGVQKRCPLCRKQLTKMIKVYRE